MNGTPAGQSLGTASRAAKDRERLSKKKRQVEEAKKRSVSATQKRIKQLRAKIAKKKKDCKRGALIKRAKACAQLASLQTELAAQKAYKNKIAALEVEYYIKSLLLDVAAHRSSNSSENLSRKKIALVFEKFDKMQDAVKMMEDPIWTHKIEIAKIAYRVDKAYKIDLEFLQKLAIGKINPQNSVEEKVKQIMMDYLDKKRANIDRPFFRQK